MFALRSFLLAIVMLVILCMYIGAFNGPREDFNPNGIIVENESSLFVSRHNCRGRLPFTVKSIGVCLDNFVKKKNFQDSRCRAIEGVSDFFCSKFLLCVGLE